MDSINSFDENHKTRHLPLTLCFKKDALNYLGNGCEICSNFDFFVHIISISYTRILCDKISSTPSFSVPKSQTEEKNL